ncbi:MAG: gliding motility-associated C-terminal domain-containing protein [Bacteroidota bacterium]
MDQRWQTIAAQRGHTSNIYEQTALDHIDSLTSADILIITSGLIDIPAHRQAVIRQFVQQGGNVYIQSEFQMTNPGNLAFETLIADLGGSFRWEGQTTGSLAPMNISGDLLSSSASAIGYFWYGTYGQGGKNIIPFLEFDRQHYGFVYCPQNPVHGKVMTISDQDWIRAFTSPSLLTQLVDYLSSSLPLQQMPDLIISTDDNPACDGQDVTFTATYDPSLTGLSFQWLVNGKPIALGDSPTMTTNSLENGDLIQCQLVLAYDCGRYSILSNTITFEEIFPIAAPQLNILADQLSACQNELLSFRAETLGAGLATNLQYTWTINGVAAGNGTTLNTTQLQDNDIIGLQLQYSDDCADDNLTTADDIQVAITPTVYPNILISVNQNNVCQGEPITFTAQGTDWGNFSILQWMVDGQVVLTNQTEFTSDQLQNGQIVSCSVLSTLPCATKTPTASNGIQVAIQAPRTPEVSIASNQTFICQGSEITLIASGRYLGERPRFIWNVDGNITQTDEPNLTVPNIMRGMQISLTAISSADCISIGTANSNVIDIELSMPEVQILEMEGDHCGLQNGMIEIEAVSGAAPFYYEWDNGQTGNLLTDLAAGTYQVTATDANGCYAMVSFEIKAVNGPTIERLDIQATDCENRNGAATAWLARDDFDYSFRWTRASDGELISERATADYLSDGTYYLEITDEYGCSHTDTITLEASGDIWFDIDAPESIALGQSAELNVISDANSKIDWAWAPDASLDCTQCDNPSISPLTRTAYTLTGTNEAGCELTKSVTINVLADRNVYIPNAFSPNNDGQNDRFTAYSGGDVQQINYLRVFDRWGGLLFERTNFSTNQESKGWDGTFQGKTLKTGVYIYTLEVSYIDGHTEVLSGDISIMP